MHKYYENNNKYFKKYILKIEKLLFLTQLFFINKLMFVVRDKIFSCKYRTSRNRFFSPCHVYNFS